MIDGEKFYMTRNVWKLINLATPVDTNEYPQEDLVKYVDLM